MAGRGPSGSGCGDGQSFEDIALFKAVVKASVDVELELPADFGNFPQAIDHWEK